MMARLAGHHLPPTRVRLFAVEAVVVALAARAGWLITRGGDAADAVTLAALAVIPFVLYWLDLYDPRLAASGRRLALALGALFALAVPVMLLCPADVRAAIVVALAASALAIAAVRAARPWRVLRRNVLALGNGAALGCLLDEMRSSDDRLVGVLRWVGGDLVERARAARADLIVVAFDDRRGFPSHELLQARLAGIEIIEAAPYLERACRKLPVELIRPASLIYDPDFRRSRAAEGARRALSLVGALVLAIPALPIAILCAIAVKLDSPGPALYRQERVGKGGRRFRIWKLRTMRDGAEAATGAVWARRDDPRITRVGRWLRRARLDELPQLVNVLAGDMDLVGPRPERPELIASLIHELPYYWLRERVRPGLTGWAQIRYPYGSSLEDTRQKLAFDLYYVKHASPILDAIVLFHTAKVVLTGRGAR